MSCRKNNEKNSTISSFLNLLKGKKKAVIIVTIILLIIFICFILPNFFKKSTPEITTSYATVDRGNITQIIEGSGTIEAIDQYEITSLVSGDILEDYFNEGDVIEKGALMYKIDTSDIDNTIKRANLSVEKSEMAYNNASDDVSNLNIKSTTSGTISNIYIKKGDQVTNGAKIVDVVNNQTMKLSIDFLSEFTKHMYIGQTAQVELIGSFSTATGTVSKIASGSMPNSYGVSVTTVEIDVSNPGGILKGDKATAIVGDYACNAPGTFDYSGEITVFAKSSGTVHSVNCTINDVVSTGTVLANLENDSIHDNLRQSSISLQEAQLSLDNYYDNLENYNITAPISGKVIQKNIKAGEKLDNTNASTPMAIISDLSSLVFTISVDELDISEISLGQKVMITADALKGQTFTGVVDNISIVGTSSNGVTSYPVRVLLDNSEESALIPGMNVDATIVIESKENVLRIPSTAVNRGNTVTLADGTQTEVEIGLSDSSFVEIISGLNEGDEIVVPVIDTSSDFFTKMMSGNMGGMPSGVNHPGGMPQGGNRAGGNMPGGR